MFLFPLKKLRLRSQWCVTGCTPSREFHWSHVRCAGCLHSSRPDPWSIQQESHQADLCPTGYSWGLSKCGSRWEKVQNRMDSTTGFSDRPHRSGNRAGSHLKKRQLGEIPLLPLWFKWGNSPQADYLCFKSLSRPGAKNAEGLDISYQKVLWLWERFSPSSVLKIRECSVGVYYSTQAAFPIIWTVFPVALALHARNSTHWKVITHA